MYTRRSLKLLLLKRRRMAVHEQGLKITAFMGWCKLFHHRQSLIKHDKKRRYGNLRSAWKKWRRQLLLNQTIVTEQSAMIAHFKKQWAWYIFRRRIFSIKRSRRSYRQLLLFSSLFTMVRVYRAWKMYTLQQRERYKMYAERILYASVKYRFREWHKTYYRYAKSIEEGSFQWRLKLIQNKAHKRRRQECWERWYSLGIIRSMAIGIIVN